MERKSRGRRGRSGTARKIIPPPQVLSTGARGVTNTRTWKRLWQGGWVGYRQAVPTSAQRMDVGQGVRDFPKPKKAGAGGMGGALPGRPDSRWDEQVLWAPGEWRPASLGKAGAREAKEAPPGRPCRCWEDKKGAREVASIPSRNRLGPRKRKALPAPRRSIASSIHSGGCFLDVKYKIKCDKLCHVTG